MEEFLIKNNLEKYVQVFHDQGLNSFEVLLAMSPEEIKEIFPILGDRLRFKIALKNISESNHNELQSHTPEDTPFIVEQRKEPSEEPCEKYMKLSATSSEDFNDIPIVYAVTPSPSCSSNCNSEILNTLNPVISDISNNTLNQTRLSFDTSVLHQNFNLKDLLKSEVVGRAIVKKYDKFQTLDNKDRNNLTEIIISYFLNNNIKLHNEHLSKLADCITEIFPNEKRSTYFVSPITKKKSRRNKPEIARGKLVDKHRNKQSWLRKTLKFEDTFEESKESENTPSEAAQNSYLWLKQNFEPEEDVIQNWKTSYPLRILNNKTIGDFLQEWPILSTQLAPELINLDFEEKFKLPSDFDIKNSLESLFNSILTKRKQQFTPTEETILGLLSTEITSDSKSTIFLYLLPSLVPPKGRTKINKTHWKPSVSESRDGLLIHIKSPAEIDQVRKNRIDSMYKKGLTVQPYIIVVGSTFSNVTSAYVVINENLYKLQSVLKALDFCFKSYIVLDAKYPFESQHLWYLIQWKIYNIKSKHDIKIPFINDLI